MFKDIVEREDQLSEWDTDFIARVEHRFKRHRFLTEKQESKLTEIYERVTENG